LVATALQEGGALNVVKNEKRDVQKASEIQYGAIQIIRDTLGGSRRCHQMTQGGGGLTAISHVIFLTKFELNFTAEVFLRVGFL
jgi:hypothetical protein